MGNSSRSVASERVPERQPRLLEGSRNGSVSEPSTSLILTNDKPRCALDRRLLIITVELSQATISSSRHTERVFPSMIY